MHRYLWLSDIHLNFLQPDQVETFFDSLAANPAAGVLISGDIAEAHNVALYLKQMDERLHCPIHFVLGNHDFYFSSIADVRNAIRELCAVHPRLQWLPIAGVVPLTEVTALVGHDGWGDGRFGDYQASTVKLNDWRLIEDFNGLEKEARLPLLQALGDEAADHFRQVLPEALQRYRQVLVVIHVPPFREACLYAGCVADDEWAPHFTCHAAGQILAETMTAHPDKQMTVLCGHTHVAADVQILPNLRVLTGGATYRAPKVQNVLEVQ